MGWLGRDRSAPMFMNDTALKRPVVIADRQRLDDACMPAKSDSFAYICHVK